MADATIELLKDPVAAVASADNGPRVREAGAGCRRRQSNLHPVLAPPDRAGACHPRRQRGHHADQGRRISRRERLRHLRLQRDAAALQAEDPGAGTLRMDRPEIELLPGGKPRNWEDSYFDRTRPCSLSSGPAGAVLHGGRTGQPTRRRSRSSTHWTASSPSSIGRTC